jgi:type I restriction-modification system DNA methylase subunit
VQKELQLRRATLVPAADVAVTITQWCQAVLFPTLGMQPQPGPRIVAEQAVFEPTFALAQGGMSIQPEYQGKAAGQELDALIWVLPWRESLDSKADVAGLEGLSAMEVAQQALVQADVAWGVVTNGKLLRLLHKASAHRSRSFLEVDLETISVQWIQPQARLAFRYMLGLFSQVSFVERDSENRTRLDRVLAQSERHGKEIGDELKQNVFKALEELGDGFLYLMRQNLELARRWQQRQGSTAPIEQYLDSDELLRTIYEESLTLLYRLLFLFYAESRDLLPMHDELYRDTYSLEALRDDIISVHDDPDPRRFFSQGATDLDVRLRELFGLIDVGFGNLIPAYNGGLFDPEQHPFLESFKVGDYYLARAIDLLSRTQPQNGQVRGEGRKKVTYRDLDVRHLREIYEGLLEYSAHIAREEQVIFERKKNNQKYEEYVAASELSAAERQQLEDYRRARAENPEFPSLPRGCSVTGVKEPGQYFLVYGGKESKRKSSGSYYTPNYIVQYIVENTLGPLVRGENREGDKQNVLLTADEILDLKVLDPAMGSGHFLVAATEYLARAYGQALIREGRDSDGAMSDAEFIRYKRMVAERCIYGVDINPMAVELAKLSLWLFTMDPQRPLSFLDHHLKCGNALIGAWIKDLGTLPSAKQHPDQLNLFEARFLAQIPLLVSNVLGIMYRETLSREDIADKKALDHAIEDLKRPFRNIADAWVATYFGEQAKDYDVWLVNPEEARGYQSPSAAQHRFFHWELEFPEVWFDANGQGKANSGFSAIIGNPPYVRTHNMDNLVKNYLLLNSGVYVGKSDIYYAFIELSDLLAGNNQYISMITKDSWLFLAYAENLRRHMLSQSPPRQLLQFEYNVFEEASVTTTVFLLEKDSDHQQVLVKKISRPTELETMDFEAIPLAYFESLPFCVYDLTISSLDRGVKAVISGTGLQLGDVCEVQFGMKTGNDAKWLSNTPVGTNPKPLYTGEEIQRNMILTNRLFVDYVPSQMRRHKATARPGEIERFERTKILVKDTTGGLSCVLDIEGLYVKDVLIVYPKDSLCVDVAALAAVINSTSMRFFYETTYPSIHVQNDELKQLPIPKQLVANSPDHYSPDIRELSRLQRAITSTSNRVNQATPEVRDRIDNIVFDLFDIPPEGRERLIYWRQQVAEYE